MDEHLKPIVILGAGGHAQEVAWLIDDLNAARPEWNLLGFVDSGGSGKQEHYGLPVLGSYMNVKADFGDPFFVCGMGDPAIRQRESQFAEELGWKAATLVHPSVSRARFVSLGQGSVVAVGSILGPNVCLGRHCLINGGTFIGHDAKLGDFNVVSPGARINGMTILEDRVVIGSNASVAPRCQIGLGAVLAANSFLQSDLAAGESAIGVPAKVFYRKPASVSCPPAHHLRHISR